MKLFADKEMTKEVEDLDFGIVLAGTNKKVEFYLYNDSIADTVELVPVISNTEVDVITFPKSLKSKEVAKIEFSWTPSLTLKKGLKTTLDIKYYELYE